MPISENEYGFSASIEGSKGVDAWLGDGARLSHYGDWIKLKGRPEIGSSFMVSYEYNKGSISQMPEDYQFSLNPGKTITLYNREGHGDYQDVYYDLVINYIGPAPAQELMPPEPENGVVEPAPVIPFVAVVRPGPEAGGIVLFPRFRAIIDRFRGAQ